MYKIHTHSPLFLAWIWCSIAPAHYCGCLTKVSVGFSVLSLAPIFSLTAQSKQWWWWKKKPKGVHAMSCVLSFLSLSLLFALYDIASEQLILWNIFSTPCHGMYTQQHTRQNAVHGWELGGMEDERDLKMRCDVILKFSFHNFCSMKTRREGELVCEEVTAVALARLDWYGTLIILRRAFWGREGECVLTLAGCRFWVANLFTF